MNDANPTACFYMGSQGRFTLGCANGSERAATKEQWIAEFQRLYPQRRLPWQGEQPSHATME